MCIAFINAFEIKIGKRMVAGNLFKGAVRLQYKYVLCKEVNQRLGGSIID